jgi:diguanylate cyclase (GGDEF)-like protein/PAS domain S-box-containing protein
MKNPEHRFHRIERLTLRLLGASRAQLAFGDEHRDSLNARFGTALEDSPLAQQVCRHVIDAGAFWQQTSATGTDGDSQDAPDVSFYAGYPIHLVQGVPIGALCIARSRGHPLSADDIGALRDMAELAQEELYAIALAGDASERMKAQWTSEALFQATFEQAAVGIAHVACDGRFIRVNRKFHDILGYDSTQVAELTFQAITHPDDIAEDVQLVDSLLSGERNAYITEKRYIHHAGKVIWANLSVVLIRDAAGAPAYFVSVIEDIQGKKQVQEELVRLNRELESRVASRTADLEHVVSQLGAEARQRELAETNLRSSEAHTRTILSNSHDAFIGIDSSGEITQWNRAAETMFGWSAAEVIGTELETTIIPPQFHAAHQAGLGRYLAGGHGPVINRRIELPARTKEDRTISVEITISPYDIDGKLFFGAFLHDISERKLATERLREKQDLLDAVLNNVDVGVIACNERGEITLFNQAAATMQATSPGMPGPEDANRLGKWFDKDAKTPLALEQTPLLRVLGGERIENLEVVLHPQGGSARYLLASGQRLTGLDGQSLGAVVSFSDITEIRHLETQRALNESRFRAIAENIPALVGQVDRDNKIVFLNRHSLRFYGKSSADMIGQDVSALYSSEEYQHIKPFIDLAREGKRATFESDMFAGGSQRHFSAVYVPDGSEATAPNGFYAMATDITARKNSEIEQAESEERLRTITDNLPVLIAYIDTEEVFRFANATHVRWLKIPLDEIIGKKVAEVFFKDLYEKNKTYLWKNLAGTGTRFETSYDYQGTTRYAQIVGIPHLKKDVVLGAYIMITDITNSKQQQAQLQLLARSDSLTGLPNRRRFEEILRDAGTRAARSGSALALMYLDVDHFKRINDSFGHAVGDEVLKQFANSLTASVRATDTVCRLAGDEFTIVLEGVRDGHDAAGVAAKILRNLAEATVDGVVSRTVSASIGIACHFAGHIDLENLKKEADAALYQSKAKGRNCYCVYEQVEASEDQHIPSQRAT